VKRVYSGKVLLFQKSEAGEPMNGKPVFTLSMSFALLLTSFILIDLERVFRIR
jgi:hypothetical protein